MKRILSITIIMWFTASTEAIQKQELSQEMYTQIVDQLKTKRDITSRILDAERPWGLKLHTIHNYRDAVMDQQRLVEERYFGLLKDQLMQYLNNELQWAVSPSPRAQRAARW